MLRFDHLFGYLKCILASKFEIITSILIIFGVFDQLRPELKTYTGAKHMKPILKVPYVIVENFC